MYKIMFILKTGEPGTWMFCLVVRSTDACMYMPYTICNIQYTYAYAYHMYIDIDSNIDIYRHAYVYVDAPLYPSDLSREFHFWGPGPSRLVKLS